MLSETTLSAVRHSFARDRAAIRSLVRRGPTDMPRNDPVAAVVEAVREVDEFQRQSADEEMREPVEA